VRFNFAAQSCISSTQSLIYLCVTAIIKNLLIYPSDTSKRGALCAHLSIPDTFRNNKKAISPHLFAFTMDFMYTLIAVYNLEDSASEGKEVAIVHAKVTSE
jgi:hypothetical protein